MFVTLSPTHLVTLSAFQKEEAMKMATAIGARRWDFLSGNIQLEQGSKEDYRKLSHLHYARGDPATCAGVWRAVYWDCQFPIADCRFESGTNRKLEIGNRKSAMMEMPNFDS